MKGATMLATLQRLGILPSFSRPSVSDNNPYSEALFRTLKYAPIYPGRPFEDIEEARIWVARFVEWYNNEHRHSAISFVTPAQRHAGEDAAALRKEQRCMRQPRLAIHIGGETGQQETGSRSRSFTSTRKRPLPAHQM